MMFPGQEEMRRNILKLAGRMLLKLAGLAFLIACILALIECTEGLR